MFQCDICGFGSALEVSSGLCLCQPPVPQLSLVRVLGPNDAVSEIRMELQLEGYTLTGRGLFNSVYNVDLPSAIISKSEVSYSAP